MKHKIRDILSGIMLLAGLLLMAGAVGALECGDISVKDSIVTGLIGAGTALLAAPVSSEFGKE